MTMLAADTECVWSRGPVPLTPPSTTTPAPLGSPPTGRADSLRRLQEDVLQNSERLRGLNVKVQGLLTKLRTRVKVLSECQG